MKTSLVSPAWWLAVSSVGIAAVIACGSSHDGGGDQSGGDASSDAASLDGGTSDATPGMPDAARSGVCTLDDWCWGDPSPSGGAKSGVFARTSTDVWVYGPKTAMNWNGSNWSGRADFDFEVTSMWASSANDAWAVGTTHDAATDWAAHWDGSAWTKNMPLTMRYVVGVWGSSPTDVYALNQHGLMQHWDGNAWSAGAAIPGGDQLDFYSTYEESAKDVWAGGLDKVAHWDGAAWTVQSPGVMGFLGVWASGPNDAWALGDGGKGAHWDGKGWTPFDTKLGTPAGVWTPAITIWGGGPNDVWVTTGYSGNLVHWDGKAWTKSSAPQDTYGTMHGTATNDAWVVAGTGLLHFDGKAWTSAMSEPAQMMLPGTDAGADKDRIFGLWASGASDAWAATANSVLHFDGQKWQNVHTASNFAETGSRVWGSGPTDVWVTGGDSMHHWDGSSWAVSMPPLSAFAVGGTSKNDVWIAGTELAHFDGAMWQTFPVTVPEGGVTPPVSVRAIYAHTASDAFAVGGLGPILHWDGLAWSPQDAGVSGIDMSYVWGVGNDVYATGTVNTSTPPVILKWSGSSWQQMTVPTVGAMGMEYLQIESMVGSSPSDIWAANGPSILHYDGTAWTWTRVDIIGSQTDTLWQRTPTEVWGFGYGDNVLTHVKH